MKSFNHIVQLPKYICYDNSYQLHKFCEKLNPTERSKFMHEKIYIIDRLHFKGHVEGFQKIFHPRDTWKIFTLVLLSSACGASMKRVSICDLFVSKSEHQKHFKKSLIIGCLAWS